MSHFWRYAKFERLDDQESRELTLIVVGELEGLLEVLLENPSESLP